MYEDKIIGPFTLKQSIYLLGGLGFVYVTYSKFGLKIGIPLDIIAGVIIFLNRDKFASVHIDENFIRAKRSEFKGNEEYMRWIQRNIAKVQSHIAEREARGLVADPALSEAMQMWEKILHELDSDGI